MNKNWLKYSDRQVIPGKYIYFISDAHLGTPNPKSSRIRELSLVRFLEDISPTAEEIYLLGDIFDFWFEYKRVVPKGFTRLLGTLARICDSGIPVHFFTGNHDIWVFDYLSAETGMIIHREPFITEINGKRFFLAHGDGFNESDRTFLILKKLFTNRLLQWAFARLHPNFAIWLAHAWSRKSREIHGEDPFKVEKEPMVEYVRKHFIQGSYDFLIFGHRHCPVDYPLNEKSRMIILGDWINHFTYARFDGNDLKLTSIK